MRPMPLCAAALVALTAARALAQATPPEPSPDWGSPAPAPIYVPPPAAPYAPPLALAPPRTHVEERPRYGLMIAGATVFGATYLMNAAVGYLANEGSLAIPVVGPLLLVSRNDNNRSGDRFGTMVAVFDALVQAAGVVMFVAGAAAKTRITVYDRVAIVPAAAPDGAGVAAIGRF